MSQTRNLGQRNENEPAEILMPYKHVVIFVQSLTADLEAMYIYIFIAMIIPPALFMHFGKIFHIFTICSTLGKIFLHRINEY